MMHRRSFWCTSYNVGLSALLFLFLVAAHSADARRIIAVGDLHGDFNQTRTILRLTGLIDKYNQWIGGDTYFVQLGDILDVGPDDILIVRALMKLKQQAKAASGDVIQLLGNHEMRNLAGDYTAVDPASLALSGGVAGRDALLSNTSSVGVYLRTRRAIYVHGPLLFMHGGFSQATSLRIKSIDDVRTFNSELQHALMNGTISALASHGLDLNEDNVDDVANPILVRSIRNVRCSDLHKVLDKHFPNIESIIVGHVPHNPNSFRNWRLCDGRLIDIDFGMSRWKKGDPGHVAALEINDETYHIQLIETKMEYTDDNHEGDVTGGRDGRNGMWNFNKTSTVIFGIFVFFSIFATSALTCIFCRERTKPNLLSALKF